MRRGPWPRPAQERPPPGGGKVGGPPAVVTRWPEHKFPSGSGCGPSRQVVRSGRPGNQPGPIGRNTGGERRMAMIRVGVIGYGYWGPNLVRNFAEVPGGRVTWVSDLNPTRLDAVRARYPGVQATDAHRGLIEAPEVDAVVIATPVSSHFELAMQALKAGKHVLVEKPLAASSEQARRLID